MGAEVSCDVTWKRKTVHGKAYLESSEVLFRSDDLRLRLPFSAITVVDAKDGALRLTTADGTASFAIGAKAATWADKIRNPKTLIDKLGVKAEHRVVVLGVDDAGFMAQLDALAPDVSTRVRRNADIVFYRSDTLGGLERLTKLRESIVPNGAIWVITPKGKGGIKDIDVMAAGKAAGLVDVKIAAFSATHTSTKFVIPKAQR